MAGGVFHFDDFLFHLNLYGLHGLSHWGPCQIEYCFKDMFVPASLVFAVLCGLTSSGLVALFQKSHDLPRSSDEVLLKKRLTDYWPIYLTSFSAGTLLSALFISWYSTASIDHIQYLDVFTVTRFLLVEYTFGAGIYLTVRIIVSGFIIASIALVVAVIIDRVRLIPYRSMPPRS